MASIPYSDPQSNPDSNGYPYQNPNEYANPNPYENTDEYADEQPNPNPDEHAESKKFSLNPQNKIISKFDLKNPFK